MDECRERVPSRHSDRETDALAETFKNNVRAKKKGVKVSEHAAQSHKKYGKRSIQLGIFILISFLLSVIGISYYCYYYKETKLSEGNSSPDMAATKAQKPQFVLVKSCYDKLSVYRAPSKQFKYRLMNCGEDAMIDGHSPRNRYSIFAIADGVGGWAMQDVDPSEFAWGLMSSILNVFKEQFSNTDLSDKKLGMHPMEILNIAHSRVIQGKKIIAGSSTACVAVIDFQEKKLNVVNVGDSGFILLRNGKVYVHSKEHQRGYNFPYQLSPLHYTDSALQGDKYELKLLDHDILLFGTDGLFDNLYDNQILSIIGPLMDKDARENTNLKKLQEQMTKSADTLLETCKKWSVNNEWESPFSAYTKKFPEQPPHFGGKLDDTSFMLLYILPLNASSK
jgi:protein phosphatase PTC7